jgi:hypothetical protein
MFVYRLVPLAAFDVLDMRFRWRGLQEMRTQLGEDGLCVNPLKRSFIICKDSARTSKITPKFTITNINWLMLFKEITPVYDENLMKYTHTKQTY